ncbi:hypothetical protein ACFL4O_00505 [bacterium]
MNCLIDRIFSFTVYFPLKFTKQLKTYRNPIFLAKEFQSFISNSICNTEADLARLLDVSRTRVNQILKLLTLSPDVIEIIEVLSDPLPSRIISESALRPIVKYPHEIQIIKIKQILGEELCL